MVALLLAASLAVASSLVGTTLLIDWLIARKVGQPIHEDVPEGHTVKAGTPTMGGLVIVGAAVAGYLVAHVRSGLVFTRTGMLVMGCIAGAARVGLIDDWIKVRNERNLGLTKRAKTAGLLVVAIGFSIATVRWTDVETTLSFTRFDSPGFELGTVGWCIWAVLLIFATTNAVNLTDGLDGLAAGSSIFVFCALMVIGFWAFRHRGHLRDPPRPRPRGGRRRDGRRVRRVPLVERRARRGSSWATPARWRSAPAWPPSSLTLNASCSCRSSARSTSPRRCR